jgi:hypothetical protein
MPKSTSPPASAHTDPFADVRPILTPRSVAVIGASDQPGNLGGETVRRLLQFKFFGPGIADQSHRGDRRRITVVRQHLRTIRATRSRHLRNPGPMA